MTKRVFIIGAPLEDKYSVFYKGVLADVNNFYHYFKSPTGGGFTDQEIIYLENPSWKTLKMYLQIYSADFVALVFSGHGYYSTSKNRTVFNINPKERASIREITDVISASKKLIISDTCRVYREDEYHYLEGIGDPMEYMFFNSELSITQARNIFDRNISKSNNGTQILYSCSPGESSVIKSSGSVFCNSLLRSIDNWTRIKSSQGTMTGTQAFKVAERALYKYTQTPQCRVSAPDVNFPLALKRTSLIGANRALY